MKFEHQKINSTSPQFFPSGLNNYNGWLEILSAHGSIIKHFGGKQTDLHQR